MVTKHYHKKPEYDAPQVLTLRKCLRCGMEKLMRKNQYMCSAYKKCAKKANGS